MQDPKQRTRWEGLLDDASAAAAGSRLSDALVQLRRLRAWQRRRNRGGLTNHEWHDAELLWLEGVVLEHAHDSAGAAAVWLRLARLFTTIAPHERYFLPKCSYCAERELGFAPNWFSVATQLRDRAQDLAATIALFRQHALGDRHRVPTTADDECAGPVSLIAPPVKKRKGNDRVPAGVVNLRPKRETIRLAYRELNQPSVVVHLSEEYVKLDPLDGAVWIWYGHRLIELGRYREAATALQTARGLVTRDDLRGLVLTCEGDLEFRQGRFAEAEARYRDATACEGGDDWAWIMLGRVRFNRGALADAEHCFRAAVDIQGRHPATALYELGLVLRARSSLFEARRVLRQALALSSHADIHDALADIERVIRLQSRNGKRPTDVIVRRNPSRS
jgi:tetratricopeptide (TPR) repeat protein